MANQTVNIDRKLDDLIDKIEILVDVIEKGGRGNRPSSMYHVSSMYNRHDNSNWSMHGDFLGERERLNTEQFDKIIDNFIKQLKSRFDDINSELESIKKSLKKNRKSLSTKRRQLASGVDENGNPLTPEQINKLQDEIDGLERTIRRDEDRQRRQQSASSSLGEEIEDLKNDKGKRNELYDKKHARLIRDLGQKWDEELSVDEKEKYGNDRDNYIRSSIDRENYINETQNRNDASNLIARSGLGNTAVGRFSQNVIERNQRIADIGNFGNELKNGGAAKIGKAMFGNSKAAGVATKALGGFGKVLGGATKLLGGFASGLMIVIEVLKLIGSAMNDWKKATAEMYKHQTRQEELQYELSKQEMLIENKMKIENISAQGDIQLKMLDTQGATMLEALKITTGQYAKSVEIALGPLTKGINESAYDAAMARIDTAASIEKLGIHQAQRETQYGRYAELRGLQQKGKLAGLEAERGVAQTQYTTESQRAAMEHTQYMEKNHNLQMLVRDEHSNLLNYDANTGKVTEDNSVGGTNVATGQRSKVVTNTNEAGVGNIMNSNMVGANWEKIVGYQEGQHAKQMAMAEYSWSKMTQAADYNAALTQAQYDLATTQKEYATQIADKQLEIETEKKEIIIDAAVEVKKEWLQLAQSTEKYLENFDSVTNDLGINMGYTSKNQLHTFQTSMFSVVENVSSKFGKDIDEIVKMQQSYIETTGRNRSMSESDWGQMTALSKYLGDDGLAASYASEMEIFNTGVSDSVDMLGEALQDVNRIGLNGRKYTKTLVDNLKLAQKYNFKGGTKGLMDMAKWAENTRFNLASLGGMIDKVREGGLEGVITQGAQFQVLGGHSAMNADPIAMMYEAYADPEAYAKRMQDMTKGYGQLDRKTGETKFSGNEVMMMEQIAKVQGRSLEEVQNEVRARNKKEVVSKQLSGNFNDEQQSFISNNATYNKETGQFEVNVMGADGKFTPKSVNELTQSDLENIMPEKHDEKMEKYMEKVVSAVESMKGEEIAEKANIAAATYEEMLNAYAERTRIAHESFAEHREQYIEEAKAGMNKITQSFEDYIGIFDQGNKEVEDSVKKIEGTANNINAALNETANVITAANAKIASAGGIGYDAPTSNGQLQQPQESKKHSMKVPKSEVTKSSVPSYSELMGSNVHRTGYDFVANNNNRPMISEATNITKVQDGTSKLVKSDRKDSAIFAKQGGPFDKLFNGVFNKINDVHNVLSNANYKPKKRESKTMLGRIYNKVFDSSRQLSDELWGHIEKGQQQKQMANSAKRNPNVYAQRMNGSREKEIQRELDSELASIRMANLIDIIRGEKSDYAANTYNDEISKYMTNITERMGNGMLENSNGNSIHFDTLKVEISGSLELSSNGESIDIMNEFRNNPFLMRSLSRMLSEHISSAMNGGRGVSNFSIGSV